MGKHCHRTELVFEASCRHSSYLEPDASQIAGSIAGRDAEGTARDESTLALRLQLLHVLLLYGILGLEAMADGIGLDGPSRHQYAFGRSWSRMRLAQHAPAHGL